MLNTSEIFEHIKRAVPNDRLLRSIVRTPGYPKLVGTIVAEHLSSLTGKSHVYLIGEPQEHEGLESILKVQREMGAGKPERAVDTIREAIPFIIREKDRSVRTMFLWFAENLLRELDAEDAIDLRKELNAVSVNYDPRDIRPSKALKSV